MIKSLYIRMILTFFGAVLISVILSFFLNGRIYGDQLRTYIQDSMIANGKTIIQSYEQSYPHNLDSLVKGITALPIYSIRIFDKEGIPLHETGAPPNNLFHVSSERLQTVLSGGVYRDLRSREFEHMTVGLPFQIDGEPYALFITSEFSGFASVLSDFFRNQLLIVLFIGTLFIVISARYIVRPLQYLTKATRRM